MKIKSALIASVLVSLAYTTFILLTSTGGRAYFSEVDWEEVDRLPYREAQAYLLERSKEIDRIESLRSAIQYPEFWWGGVVSLLIYAGLCFVACWLYVRFSQSNKPFQTDAAEPRG